uniref:Heat shock protein 4 n=1 Tax=Triticum aestivum TaxID=4565 RepID=A0A2Z6ERV7_WHEAT|nr:heat shock protein 4 [Triticum aestivum]
MSARKGEVWRCVLLRLPMITVPACPGISSSVQRATRSWPWPPPPPDSPPPSTPSSPPRHARPPPWRRSRGGGDPARGTHASRPSSSTRTRSWPLSASSASPPGASRFSTRIKLIIPRRETTTSRASPAAAPARRYAGFAPEQGLLLLAMVNLKYQSVSTAMALAHHVPHAKVVAFSHAILIAGSSRMMMTEDFFVTSRRGEESDLRMMLNTWRCVHQEYDCFVLYYIHLPFWICMDVHAHSFDV